MKKWAYIVSIPNVGDIAYAKAFFDREGIVNPVTAKPYTAEELAAIQSGAKEGAGSYRFDLPENAVLGMGGFWYNEENATAIVSHADPLTQSKNGEFLTADGQKVAEPIA